MNNSLLNRNLIFLKKKDPFLYERILTLKVSKSYVVKNSKSGSPSLIHIDKEGNKKLIDSNSHRHVQADKILTVDHPWYYKGFVQNEVKMYLIGLFFG